MAMYYLTIASAFFVLCIFFNGVSAGFGEKMGKACSKEDMIVSQSPQYTMPNGLKAYSVDILNVCTTTCSIAEIHLTCGWFSSGVEIDPKIFKRLRYNDCLVNDGNPIRAGGSVSFVYAQVFQYPMVVSSMKCLP
ncbi:hypothetical protein SUGI_1030680 [Cryptomeria japonica]|nr:hypothetical protein SUGI_1030680 [Cryptomeria japonica]